MERLGPLFQVGTFPWLRPLLHTHLFMPAVPATHWPHLVLLFRCLLVMRQWVRHRLGSSVTKVSCGLGEERGVTGCSINLLLALNLNLLQQRLPAVPVAVLGTYRSNMSTT